MEEAGVGFGAAEEGGVLGVPLFEFGEDLLWGGVGEFDGIGDGVVLPILGVTGPDFA